MKTPLQFRKNSIERRTFSSFGMAAMLVAALVLPEIAMAAGEFDEKACDFLGSISNLLNIASIAVVTIAIVFAGYQIAFAHKRIADVAPILIGGLLIGAAGQLAKWIMPDNAEDCTTMLIETVKYIA